jgi:hypothetical protein
MTFERFLVVELQIEADDDEEADEIAAEVSSLLQRPLDEEDRVVDYKVTDAEEDDDENWGTYDH